MRTSLLRNCILLVALARAGALTTDTVNQQLDAAPGGKIVVDVDFGTVDVGAGADNRVDVQAERKIDTSDEEREKAYLAAAPITVSKEGNTITVRAHRQSHESWSWSGHVKMDAHYAVKVPKNFSADLRTGGGSIAASDLVGTMNAHTSGGKLRFTQLHGEVNGKTSGGRVDLKDCEGPLVVETSGGAIEASGGNGKLDARTSGGQIRVKDFSGDTKVETSGGQLALVNIKGLISGRTSGGSVHAMLPAPLASDVKLETSAGSIDVAVPSTAAFNLDAQASAGHVMTDLPFVGDRASRESLHGAVNGGGKSMHLRSGAGSIHVHSAGPETASL